MISSGSSSGASSLTRHINDLIDFPYSYLKTQDVINEEMPLLTAKYFHPQLVFDRKDWAPLAINFSLLCFPPRPYFVSESPGYRYSVILLENFLSTAIRKTTGALNIWVWCKEMISRLISESIIPVRSLPLLQFRAGTASISWANMARRCASL